MVEFKENRAYVKERQKTADDRAEDIAYTINHAIACSFTDFIDPFVNKWFQDNIGHKIHIGCGHHHDHEFKPYGSLGHSLIGEIAGDFGSVPIAIMAQRLAPDTMAQIRNLAEPFAGPAFHASAEKSAMRWALKHGIAYNSEAYQQRVEEIYEHEMDHLPQAMVWTLASIGLNTMAQRMTGNTHSPVTIATGKALGSLITTGLVIGTRAAAPQKAREWDKFTSNNIFKPTTKFIGKMFGISSDVVDKVVDREEGVRDGTWEERIRHSTSAEQQAQGDATIPLSR